MLDDLYAVLDREKQYSDDRLVWRVRHYGTVANLWDNMLILQDAEGYTLYAVRL